MPLDTHYDRTEHLISQLVGGLAERSFYVTSRSYFADSALQSTGLVDEIMLGLNALNAEGGEDGTFGEFGFRWKTLGKGFACQMHAFEDGWQVFPLFEDVLKGLPKLPQTKDPRMWKDHNGRQKCVSPDVMADFLVGLGIRDRTKTQP